MDHPVGGDLSDAARFASLTALIAPRSVAMLGASNDPTRIGGRPIAYMKAQNFAGPIYPVNPNRDLVQGLTAYPDIASLPEIPDVAIVAVPAAVAVEAVAELAARGVKGAIVLTAGFAEVDAEGAARQEAMVAAARAHGMRLIGPNCLGVFDGRTGYYATFSASFDGGWPSPGRIGIASQSGAFGTHLFAAARNRGIGASLCITTGNEADVTVGDAIGWMAGHADTDVIAVYAEGVHHGPSFIAALAAAKAAKKPVVMMKVGRSVLGSRAAMSHTASIAGDDAVTDAVLAEFGVARARTTEELLDIVHTATRRIYPVGNTLGVLTISGGGGVVCSDAAEACGLSMPAMPEAAQAELKSLVSFCAPRNPVDCTAQVTNDFPLVGTFMDRMVRDGGYQSVIAFFSQIGSSRRAPELRAQLKAVRDRYPDRLYVLSVIAPAEQLAEYEADGFVCHEDPARAVAAVAAMGRFGEAFAEAAPAAPPETGPVELPDATPSEAAAKALLAEAGIVVSPERVCVAVEEAVEAAESLGFPVVMKIVSPDILHKSEIGGVILNIASTPAVRAAFTVLKERAATAAPTARLDGVLVAKQISGGVECILGIHRDPVFGPVAMFGLGGIFVEVMKDVVFRRCPFGVDVAEAMIRSIKGAPLLCGARGRPKADIAALAEMLARLSAFAVAAGPRLASIDLNPVVALAEGEGAFALDAVIELDQ